LPTFNGQVLAIKISGDYVYVGGSFSTVSGLSRGNLARLSRSTKSLDSWNPAVGSACQAIDADTNGYIYIAGYFSTVGGVSRSKIARFTSAGTLDSWQPPGTISGNLFALAVNDTYVYVSGYYSTIGGVSRKNLAALNISDATVASGFVADTDEGVYFCLACNNDLLAGYGSANSINGQSAILGAIINANTGSLVRAITPEKDSSYVALSGKNNIKVTEDTITLGLMTSYDRYSLVTAIDVDTLSYRNLRT